MNALATSPVFAIPQTQALLWAEMATTPIFAEVDILRAIAIQVFVLQLPSRIKGGLWINVTASGRPDNRQDRGNCFASVICFSSQTPTAAIVNVHNLLVESILTRYPLVSAKGNIHPFAAGTLRNRASLSKPNPTIITIITGQTENIVIRISSVRVSGCYQQQMLLPVTNNLQNNWNIMVTLNRNIAIYHSAGYPEANSVCVNSCIQHGPIGGDTDDSRKEMKENRGKVMRMAFEPALLGNDRDHKN